MEKFKKLWGYGEKGFTLIEILVVVAILGFLAAVVIPNVASFIGAGEEEAKQMELHNVQTAVLALLTAADAHKLDDKYDDVQELPEVHTVTAKDADDTVHYLDDYLIGGAYPLMQAYDIKKDGLVKVS